MKLTAFDLNKIDRDFLRRGIPLSQWPTTDIEVETDDIKEKTCIASWRWDVTSIHEVSYRMSECAWDALNLRFEFLLCDIISIPQNSPDIANILITFSKLYYTLHSVIAYDADVEIRRTWLKNEAIKILNSPTTLYYVYHKWKFRIPLIFSLIVKQICTRRLGLHSLNFDKIGVCDTEEGVTMTLKDLSLFQENMPQNTTTISLNRIYQKYASDVLLVYETNKGNPRLILMEKLTQIKSNCVLIPALLAIWALVEGLSISVRGCDWDVDIISDWIYKLLIEAHEKMSADFIVTIDIDQTIILEGAINGELKPEIVSPPFNLSLGIRNLFVLNDGKGAITTQEGMLENLLMSCLALVVDKIKSNIVSEPPPLPDDVPEYELLFDNNPHY